MGKRGRLPKNNLPVDSPSPVTTAKMKEQERRWRAEDALRCINRAEEFKSDKGLMKDVKELAQEQMTSLKRIAKV
jgi:hypothetical protein